MELKPHQLKAVRETPDKHCLFFACRVGKTPTSIRFMCQRAKRCLVIVPKSLKFQWELEIARWSNSGTEFFVRSKEDVRLKKDIPFDLDGLIWDEVHMAGGNHKSLAYKAAEKLIKIWGVKFILLLTGTPWTSNSWSIYSYAKLLGRPWKWWDWSQRFFYQVKMGNRMIPIPRTDRDEELQTIIRRIGTVIDLKDVAEVPDDEDIVETFTLNTEQKKLIKDSFDPLPIVRFTRQHQIESGCLKGDGYNEDKIIECDKDKRLLEIAAESNKLIIVCRYLAQLDKYEKMFKDRVVFRVSGQEQKTASETAQIAERVDNCIVLIQGDTVAGYNLQSFSVVVFASMSYSYVNYEQVRYRTKNMEKKVGCTYIHLLTEGDSVDKAVYDCVKNKQDFSVELFSKKYEKN